MGGKGDVRRDLMTQPIDETELGGHTQNRRMKAFYCHRLYQYQRETARG